MKRTDIADPIDIAAHTIAKVIWAVYRFITEVVPILFIIWLALSVCEVVFNLDHFMAGTTYEYSKLNLFFILKNLFGR